MTELIRKLHDVEQSVPNSKLMMAIKQPVKTSQTGLILQLPADLMINSKYAMYLGITYDADAKTYRIDDDSNITDHLDNIPAKLYFQLEQDLTSLAEFNNINAEIDSADDLAMTFYDETASWQNVKVIVANFCDLIRDVQQYLEKLERTIK